MDYYTELKKLVDKGDVVITSIVGPSRSGTTALEKWMYNNFSFTAQVNQPGLEADSEQSTWQEIYDSAIEAMREHGKPARILIKNTSHYIYPGVDLQKWMDISQAFVVCVRNPLLQTESLMSIIADKVGVGGIDGVKDLDKASAACYHNQPLLDTNATVPWDAYIKHPDQHRMPAFLPAFQDCIIHEPAYAQPVFLKKIFKDYSTRPANIQKAPSGEIDACAAYDASRFEHLPGMFKDALVDWRMGWTGTKILTENFAQKKKPFVVMDFSCFQCSPDYYRGELAEFLGANNCIAASAINAKRKGFSVQRGASNASHTPTFIDHVFSNAMQNENILPPTKKPAHIEDFAPFLRPMVTHALKRYKELCNLPQAITFPTPLLQPLTQLDPVTVHCATANASVPTGYEGEVQAMGNLAASR